jgi:hypothetical protein
MLRPLPGAREVLMPRLTQQSLCLVALALFVTTCTAHAKPFDVIYADRINVTNPSLGSGFSYDKDIGIVVNTGTSWVTASELAGATFTTSCSDPSVSAVVWIDDAGLGGPLVPNEAVGSLGPGSVLPWLLYPGEILRMMWPNGVMWLRMDYPPDFGGTVVVGVTMAMGTDVAHYLVTVNFSAGEGTAITMPHATRVSSAVVTDVGMSFGGGTELRFARVGNAGTVAFELGLPDAADVEVALYDVAGRRVATLSDGALPAGRHTLSVPGRKRLSSGMYFARAVVRTPERSVERVAKAIVVR